MQRLQSGAVFDLHLAAAALRDNQLWLVRGDPIKQFPADIHRYGVLFTLEAEGASHATAVGLDLLDFNTRNGTQQAQPGSSDALRFQMTRGVISEFAGRRFEIYIQFAGIEAAGQ